MDANQDYFEKAGFVVPKAGKARNWSGELDRAVKECQRIYALNASLVSSENRLLEQNLELRARLKAFEEAQQVDQELAVGEDGPPLEG